MFLRSAVLILSASVVALAGSPAWAESAKLKPADVKTHPHARAAVTSSASTRAYEVAMQKMHQEMNAPLSGNATIDFVRGMIPHHQGAVDMAKIQLQYGHDERLKTFNRWIIRAQEKEIAFMKNWLAGHDNGKHIAGATDYYGNAMMAMHHGMMVDYTGDADVDFVRGMIPHHQGAVDMASILLAEGSNLELNRLASNIYSSQTYEIAWMQDWLSTHHANPCH